VIAGISCWQFYFRLFPGAIRTPQVLEFLKALQATIGRKLLIIWDRLQAHRSKLVRQHIEAQGGAIALEYLPAYAPDPNPVECIWGYLKHRARRNLGSTQRRPTLPRSGHDRTRGRRMRLKRVTFRNQFS
jgi:transposase